MTEVGQEVKLEIGGLVLSATGRGLPDPFGIERHFRPFLSEREADLEMSFELGAIEPPDASPVFESGGVWRLYRRPDGMLRYDFADEVLGRDPYAQAIVDPGLARGKVRLRTLRGHRRNGKIYPFVYPIDEVLTISLLARRGGLHVHAAGVDDGGDGILFPGVSGAGKSTVSRMFDADPRARVLSDDRVIIRFRGGEPAIHGTPWHGEADLSRADRAPLRAVFFLRKAEENIAARMGPAEATAELIARSFPAYWDAEGLRMALATATRVTASVPAYRLNFKPDAGALRAVREVLR